MVQIILGAYENENLHLTRAGLSETLTFSFILYKSKFKTLCLISLITLDFIILLFHCSDQ